MRLATAIAIAVLAAALLAGCGSSADGGADSTASEPAPAQVGKAPAGASARECKGAAGEAVRLRATGIPCSEGLDLVAAWKADPGCAPDAGASRSSCNLSGYNCLGVVTDRGIAVGCAQPGRSAAFTVRRG